MITAEIKGPPSLAITVVVPQEKIDLSTVDDFRQFMEPVLETYDRVTLDMSQVNFVDSSGLGALLSCQRTLNNKGGDLRLCGVRARVRAMFELVRMHRVLTIAED